MYYISVYDVKYLTMKNPSCEHLRGGLNKIADQLEVVRIGPSHQAGSDSLLTASTFFKLREAYFANEFDSKQKGILYGLGQGIPASTPDGEDVEATSHGSGNSMGRR